MITSNDYAQMANAVYNIGTTGGFDVPGFTTCLFYEGVAPWGTTATKFKGCVYANNQTKEAVVAFQGTDFGNKIGDWYADLQIVVGILPQYCMAADRLYARTLQVLSGYTITLTGHSLGGALAQVIGHWRDSKFVTFNAPGMWGDIQKSKLLSLSSWGGRSRSSPNDSKLAKFRASTGRNFRNYLDPVSAYGMHYGPVTRLWVPGLNVHGMDNMVAKIMVSKWSDRDPLDPKNKEWGELD